MKIAFDHQIFTQQSYGGVSRYFTQLALELGKQEEVRILAKLHRNQYIDELPNTIINGFNVPRVLNYAPKAVSSLNKMINRASMLFWNPNVIHETYYNTKSSGSKDCLRVITVFDMIHELFPEYFSKLDQTTKIKKIAIERADKIICISHSTKQDLIRLLGIAEEKIAVTHLGHHYPYTQEQSKVSPQRPYLLYVGNRKGYKNFSGFINAFASSKTLKNDFDIVVFGGEEFSNDEIELFRKTRLDSKNVIRLSGNDAQLSIAYMNAKAFVYPSLYEGFGLPPLEAMTHQCPVISSNSSSMPEVIGDAGAYFSPKDKEDIKNTIERTVYNDNILQSLTEKGLERARMFSWQRCANETLTIYQQAR